MDRIMRRSLVAATLVLLSWAAAPAAVSAQNTSARDAYFRAVAEYFGMSAGEVSILADWNLAPDEIPVAIFVATRAGISPEALVALRGSGRGWVELTRRYQVGAAQLHVPLARAPTSGPLMAAYEQYQARPTGEWGQVSLTDEDIVALVNVRVLSAALGMRPDDVLTRRARARSFVEVYAGLIG